MSLLTQSFEPFVIMDKTTAPDGYGGIITQWTEGAQIEASANLDDSTEARIAEQQGVKAMYTITTSRSINLQYNDYLKRVRDGKVFRATSDGDDKLTPRSTRLDMRQVSAVETELPNG